jgi:hypothetical protein
MAIEAEGSSRLNRGFGSPLPARSCVVGDSLFLYRMPASIAECSLGGRLGEPYVGELGAVIGAHVGPGLLAMVLPR